MSGTGGTPSSDYKSHNNPMILNKLPVASSSVIGFMSWLNGLVCKQHERNVESHVKGLMA